MSGWNFLTRTGITMGTSYSKVCYQFLQLFRFRVESMVKMRKHLSQPYNLTNTSWNSRWGLSVQGVHLRYLDSSLYTGHQLKQRLPFPTNASNTKSQNSSCHFCLSGLFFLANKEWQNVRVTESVFTVRTDNWRGVKEIQICTAKSLFTHL